MKKEKKEEVKVEGEEAGEAKEEDVENLTE
jgi:hypothetical protein